MPVKNQTSIQEHWFFSWTAPRQHSIPVSHLRFFKANAGFASIWQDAFWSILTLVLMMLSAGYFRLRSALPGPGLLENEYIGTSFAVGQVRSIFRVSGSP
ncbi:ABC transporter G family member 3 [Vitis vinifera]|uniref:ABC transporter G family member 3 n=1 Tax=Vitis vinifera TaxID=29760 RepID=A0A438C2R6_VITVI|nr:ABC transporter G family member 3 [Vitis vinifera]